MHLGVRVTHQHCVHARRHARRCMGDGIAWGTHACETCVYTGHDASMDEIRACDLWACDQVLGVGRMCSLSVVQVSCSLCPPSRDRRGCLRTYVALIANICCGGLHGVRDAQFRLGKFGLLKEVRPRERSGQTTPARAAFAPGPFAKRIQHVWARRNRTGGPARRGRVCRTYSAT